MQAEPGNPSVVNFQFWSGALSKKLFRNFIIIFPFGIAAWEMGFRISALHKAVLLLLIVEPHVHNRIEMTLNQITFLLIFVSLLGSCKQGEIIGNWRKIKPYAQDQGIKISKDFGDMTINSDSTFYVQGDTINQTSSTPGWHLSGDYNGKWGYSKKKYLILTVANGKSPFPNSYKIVRLTKKYLVLLPAFSRKRNKLSILKYLRQ